MGNIPVNMRPRKSKNRGLEPNVYADPKQTRAGIVVYYKYINPVTKEPTHWGRVTEAQANAAGKILNARLMPGADLVAAVLGTAGKTWNDVLDEFEKGYPKWETWGERTVKEHRTRIKKYRRDLGHRDFATYSQDTNELGDYINTEFTGDGRTQNRNLLSHIYKFAIAEKYVSTNRALETLAPPKGKRKQKRLELSQFKAIREHEECPDWLQCAMDFSLKTLQARKETVRVLLTDIHDGVLDIVRSKTKERTEKAYIRIVIDDELQEILDRCRALPVTGNRLIRRRPKNRRYAEDGPGWSAVSPRILSEEFARVRDATGLFDHLPEEERPGYHSIRSLGGRLLKDQLMRQGYTKAQAKEVVNQLYGHTTIAQTEVYLRKDEPEWNECKPMLRIGDL